MDLNLSAQIVTMIKTSSLDQQTLHENKRNNLPDENV